MAGDILVARPFGVVLTAVGSVLFVVSLPFTALGGRGQTKPPMCWSSVPRRKRSCVAWVAPTSGRYHDPNDVGH